MLRKPLEPQVGKHELHGILWKRFVLVIIGRYYYYALVTIKQEGDDDDAAIAHR